jgi:hypothetical protein
MHRQFSSLIHSIIFERGVCCRRGWKSRSGSRITTSLRLDRRDARHSAECLTPYFSAIKVRSFGGIASASSCHVEILSSVRNWTGFTHFIIAYQASLRTRHRPSRAFARRPGGERNSRGRRPRARCARADRKGSGSASAAIFPNRISL